MANGNDWLEFTRSCQQTERRMKQIDLKIYRIDDHIIDLMRTNRKKPHKHIRRILFWFKLLCQQQCDQNGDGGMATRMAWKMLKWMISHLSGFTSDASKVDLYLYAMGTRKKNGAEKFLLRRLPHKFSKCSCLLRRRMSDVPCHSGKWMWMRVCMCERFIVFAAKSKRQKNWILFTLEWSREN